MTHRDEEIFKEAVWDYYRANGRDLPWRHVSEGGTIDPYAVLVSEIMLQQTQVSRVIPKYDDFLRLFPNAAALAAVELGDVIRAWSGLGYNRRARFLWLASKEIVLGGSFPDTKEALVALPGIGSNTAAAVLTYAFNQRHVFIETNIRTVFLHQFFPDEDMVGDKLLLPLVEATLPDDGSFREWYWALMDYGTHLKRTRPNPSRRSAHHTRQSRFEGSRRQVRGAVLRLLADGEQAEDDLVREIPDERISDVLADLLREGLIRKTHGSYRL